MLLWEVRLYLWNVPKLPLVTLPQWARSICAVCRTVRIELRKSRTELGSEGALVVLWGSLGHCGHLCCTPWALPALTGVSLKICASVCCLLGKNSVPLLLFGERREASQVQCCFMAEHISVLWSCVLFKIRPSRLQLCSSFLHSLECAPVRDMFFY